MSAIVDDRADVMAERLDAVVSIAKVAGKKILEHYESGVTVTSKEDDTPLTEADLAANKIIIEQLQSLSPELPILTEESCGIPFAERHEWNTYWLVDPLDGTREFINHNGEFSVNIALIHKGCLLYTSPSPRDGLLSRMPSSA